MLPKEYFDDTLTEGVAFEHVLDNRFTLLKLPVGYGKTVIAMRVAKLIRSRTYIIRPEKKSGTTNVLVPYAKRQYDRIISTSKWNKVFEEIFVTRWGKYDESIFEKGRTK